jgi:hypothetical protein
VPPNGNFPSSSALPLILDATARIIAAPATDLGTNNPNYVTFGAGEAIMLPLCYPSYSAGTTADPSQDSKITFDTSATITVSLLNSSTGKSYFGYSYSIHWYQCTRLKWFSQGFIPNRRVCNRLHDAVYVDETSICSGHYLLEYQCLYRSCSCRQRHMGQHK